MANFNAARAAVPAEIQTQTTINPGVVDSATAAGVEAFGKLGGEARKGLLKDELKKDVENASLITNLLNTSPDVAITDEGVDISKADPDGVIDQFRKGSMKRLSEMHRQGKIDINQVALESEALLRQAVARAPGFEAELRQVVADAVGFDVTGAATRTFFGNSRTSGGPKTKLDLIKEQAEVLSADGTRTYDSALKLLIKAENGELDKEISDMEFASGRIAAFDYGLENSARFEAETLFRIQQSENPLTGDIDEPEKVKEQIRLDLQQYQARALLAAQKNGRLGRDARADITQMFQDSLEASMALVDDKDAREILKANATAVENATFLEANRMLHKFFIVKQAFGAEGMVSAIRMLDQMDGDPEQIANRMERDPFFKEVFQILKGVPKDELVEIVPQVHQGGNPDETSEQVERNNAGAQLMVEDAIKTGDDEALNAGVGYQLNHGLSKMPISQIARQKGAWTRLDAERRDQMVTAYSTEVATTQGNLVNKLAVDGLRLAYTNTDPSTLLGFEVNAGGPRFHVVTDTGFNAQAQRVASGIGSGGGGGVRAQDDMGMLNDVLLGMQINNSAFLKDAGITDTDAWAQQLVDNVNNLIEIPLEATLQAAVAADQGLTRLDAGTFGDDRGNIIEVDEKGKATTILSADGEVGLVPDRSVTPKFKESQQPIVDTITKAGEAQGVDPRLLIAIAKVESSLNPEAANNKENPGVAEFNEDGSIKFTSALGLFQNLTDNFAEFGPEGGDRSKPEDSVQAAINFIKFLEPRTEDLTEMLIKWHDGQNSTGASPAALAFAKKVKGELGLLRAKAK
jgi:hypothetical protein